MKKTRTERERKSLVTPLDPPRLQMVVHKSDVSSSTNLTNWLWVSSFFQWLIQGVGSDAG